jgi:hypothetical protein
LGKSFKNFGVYSQIVKALYLYWYQDFGSIRLVVGVSSLKAVLNILTRNSESEDSKYEADTVFRVLG